MAASYCPKIAVIIPFYQREPGFLRQAVHSVFAQKLSVGASVQLIVVDDGSPSSIAAEDLNAAPPGFEVRLLRQANGGAGAARNSALDALDGDTDYVAFLDSDDIWYENHLELALSAFTPDVDCFFSNNFSDDGIDTFSYSRYMRTLSGVNIEEKANINIVSGAEIFDESLDDVFIHTSQFVYRFSMGPEIRFSTDFRRSGEDLLFFIELAAKARKVAFTAAHTGLRGRGVSIYRETLAWGSPLGMETKIDEILLRARIFGQFSLTARQQLKLRTELQKASDHLLFLMLRNARLHPKLVFKSLLRVTRFYPRIWTMMPQSALGLSKHRAQLLAQAATSPSRPK